MVNDSSVDDVKILKPDYLLKHFALPSICPRVKDTTLTRTSKTLILLKCVLDWQWKSTERHFILHSVNPMIICMSYHTTKQCSAQAKLFYYSIDRFANFSQISSQWTRPISFHDLLMRSLIRFEAKLHFVAGSFLIAAKALFIKSNIKSALRAACPASSSHSAAASARFS